MCQTLTYRKIGIEQVTAYAKRNETSLISVIIFKSIGRKKKIRGINYIINYERKIKGCYS